LYSPPLASTGVSYGSFPPADAGRIASGSCPLGLDRRLLSEEQQRVGHLVAVERGIGVAVPKTLPIGADRPVAGKYLWVDCGQDVLFRRSPVRFGDFRIRQIHRQWHRAGTLRRLLRQCRARGEKQGNRDDRNLSC
jgi:hypothetical protein